MDKETVKMITEIVSISVPVVVALISVFKKDKTFLNAVQDIGCKKENDVQEKKTSTEIGQDTSTKNK